MENKLAQELKEAGFRGIFSLYKDPNSNRTSANSDGTPIAGWDEIVCMPPLSQLIEAVACIREGDMRLHTKFTLDQVSLNDWRACTEKTDFIHGSTPEEAVAMLYLALHGKTRTPMEGK